MSPLGVPARVRADQTALLDVLFPKEAEVTDQRTRSSDSASAGSSGASRATDILGRGVTGAKPPTGEPHSDRRGLSDSTDTPSAATKREPLLKWLRSPCDVPNGLFIALSLLLVIVSLFDLMRVGK